ncbi:MAG: penicillin-binding transpeptidase domain-containing protein, partial [Sphaerochaetaceae bacterium]|nr:penicillin-binding transpeptidase domain-containing protein [Sphaerochaetaceae bacterium]
TARLTAIEGVRIASKTGTAQILDEETNSYDSSNFLASTLSIFPVEDPQYIVYIAVVNPKGSTIWGSNIAGPAIAQIIKGLLRQGKLFSDTTEKIML